MAHASKIIDRFRGPHMWTCLVFCFLYSPTAKSDSTVSKNTIPSTFPQIIYEQLDQRVESDVSAKRTILETDPNSLRSPIEKGVFHLLRGAQFLKEAKKKEASIELHESLRLIPKESQLTPLIEIMAIEADLSKTKTSLAMQKLKTIIGKSRITAEWKPEQYALMLRILVEAKADRLLAKAWGDYESHVRPAQRIDEMSHLMADYLETRLKTPDRECIAVVESMASFYPYSPEGRWAFHKLEQLKCHQEKLPLKNRYAPSLWYLSRLAGNAVLDEGLRYYVYSATSGLVRTTSGEIKSLDVNERITFLTQARLYRESSALAEQELTLVPSSLRSAEGKVRRAKALSQLGQIQVRMNDWSSAARTYALFIEEYSDQFDYRYALESLADSLVRLRAHRAAAKIYGKLATSTSADPVLRWHHFWNTYLDGDFATALELIDRPGYVPQRDRGIDGGLDYWRAKVLEKLGRKQQAEEIFKRILAANGDTYYSILIQALRPGIIEVRNRTSPPTTHDEGQEVQDEIGMKESFAAKLLTNGSNVGSADATKGERLDLGTARLLQKWGDYRSARRLIRSIPWTQVVVNKLYPQTVDLAFTLGDYGYGLKAASLPDSPFKAVPSAVMDLIDHIAKNNSDWRFVYPMAYERLVLKYADETKIDPFIILSLMRAESVYDPDARSIVGAQGLMQIMPFTAIRIARVMNDPKFELKNLHVPEVNIGYASFYIRKLLDYYSGNILLAVASYNAGPIAVDRWVSTFSDLDMDELVETISFKETRRYVKTVLRNFNQYKQIYSAKQALTVLPKLPQIPADQEIF